MGAPQKKLKIKLPYDTENLLRGIYLKELKARSRGDICVATFIAALFPIAKRHTQPI